MDNRIMFFFRFIGGIYSFHTHIKAEDEIVEVHTEAKSVCCGNLLVECVKPELSGRLFFVIPYRPYVPGINEYRAIEFPE